MSLIKINEAALYAAGFDRVFIETMRHIVRQVGEQTGATTLPEVAGSTDTLTPIVNGLVITITALGQTVKDLGADEADLPLSDHTLVQRLDDLQADAERTSTERAGLIRLIDDLATELSTATVSLRKLEQRLETLENGVL